MKQTKTNQSEALLHIGKVAKLAGVGVETIRFYERQGVLPPPKRKESGYRLFGHDTVDRLRFIKRIQSAGFSLQEAGKLAAGRGSRQALDAIKSRIEELQQLSREIARSAA